MNKTRAMKSSRAAQAEDSNSSIFSKGKGIVTTSAPLGLYIILGRSRTTVVKRFPRLCMQLSAHWLKRREERWDLVGVFLQDALRNDPPLHLKAIAQQLNLSHTSLYTRFPRWCHETATRYALYLRQVRSLKKDSLRSEVRGIAIILYGPGIYPSVRKVSHELLKQGSLRNSKVALASLREIRHELGIVLKM